MDNQIRIRQFLPSDQDEACSLWVNGIKSHMYSEKSAPEFCTCIVRYLEAKCKPEGDMYNIEQSYRKSDPRKNFFVAEDITNGKLAGCVAALPSTELNGDEYLELVRMSVGSDYRGTSVGPLLVKAFEDWAGSLGYRKVTLTAWNVNIPACRFYAKLGYRVLEGQQPKLPPSAYAIGPEEEAVVGLVYFVKDLE
jgi:GNAT superfamily N-acetyltransferase